MRAVSVLAAMAAVSFARADDGAASAQPYDPTEHWEVNTETGVLWRVTGSATPLAYTVLPQLLTVESTRVGTARPLAGGENERQRRLRWMRRTSIPRGSSVCW